MGDATSTIHSYGSCEAGGVRVASESIVNQNLTILAHYIKGYHLLEGPLQLIVIFTFHDHQKEAGALAFAHSVTVWVEAQA